uniref:Piwi domain-containing protein n=1 Tax=Panagrellus redivivus TaxID=6233 RepID=A0A7E4ULD1_PANRE
MALPSQEPLDFPGSEGRPIVVKTNLFPLDIGNPALRIGIYHVKGTRRLAPQPPRRDQRPRPPGPTDPTRIRSNELYECFLRAFRRELEEGRRNTIKGVTTLNTDTEEELRIYVIPPLPQGVLPRGLAQIVNLDHNVRGRSAGTNILNVTYMRNVDFSEQAVFSDFRELMKVGLMDSLTAIFTRHNFFRIKNDLFTMIDKRVVCNVLDVLMGMKIRVHTDVIGSPMLSINMTFTSCLRVSAPLLLVYAAMILKRNVNEVTFRLQDFAGALISGPRLEEFRSLVNNFEIEIPNLRDVQNFQRSKLVGISTEPASALSVNGVNLNTYYDNAGFRIALPHMNAVMIRRGQRTLHVPMELCQLSSTPQKLAHALSQFKKEIITATAVPPVPRFGFIESIGNDITEALSDPHVGQMLLSDLQVRLQRCVNVNARVLDEPETHHKLSPYTYAMPYTAKNVKYVLLDLSRNDPNPERTKALIQDFVHFMCDRLLMTIDWRDLLFEHAFNLDQPVYAVFDEMQAVLADVFRRLATRDRIDYSPSHDQVVFFVVLPDTNVDFYGCAKNLITQAGYVSQCINEDTLLRLTDFSTKLNLALKVNAKLGGINNVPTEGNFRWMSFIMAPTMFIGIDTRNSKERNQRGIVAISVSINADATKYKFFVRRNDESSRYSVPINDWMEIVYESLAAFIGPLPQRVFILRAGMDEFNISKGESLSECMEIGGIFRHWFDQNCPNVSPPPVTYLGYNRAHNVRFMNNVGARDVRGSDPPDLNVPRGTVIDHQITHPNTFYLVTHETVAGTLKPAKYYIVTDENSICANDMLVVVYTLCCMAPRCNFPIRRPLPLAYCRLLLNYAVGTCDDVFAVGRNAAPIPENLSMTPFFI